MVCCVIGCPNHNNRRPRSSGDGNKITFHMFPNPNHHHYRMQQWLAACNNPSVQQRDPLLVYKQFRMCRLHFAANCFNGACKRLVESAVPTLHLHLKSGDGPIAVRPKSTALPRIQLRKNEQTLHVDKRRNATPSVLYNVEYFSDELDNDCDDERTGQQSVDVNILEHIDATEEDYIELYDEVEMCDRDEEEGKEILPELNEKNYEAAASAEDDDYVYEVINVIDENEQDESIEMVAYAEGNTNILPVGLLPQQIAEWKTKFYANPKNVLAQNICSRIDPFDACISRSAIETTQHVFVHKVESEGKPISNQKNSGRCWLFAALNCIRIPFMKHYNIEEFEFSQAYLFYWDKIERCNYFLNNIIETARRGEEVNGRLVSFLLNDPTCDGGQWDMIVNLIQKHGVMPKKYFPESYCCEASLRLNAVLKSKLREYTKVLRELIAKPETTDDQLHAKLTEQMGEIYTVVGICLGIPAATFKWEYYDKSKAYQTIEEVSALEFYEKYVKQCFDVEDKICLMTDPRPSNEYGRLYTVDLLGNVVGGRPVLYNNQPVEVLMDMVAKGIKNGEPIWFGCEVNKRFAMKLGIEDLKIQDFSLVFGVDIQTTLDKAERLLYGESAMTHAMVFTAVTCDETGRPTKFRVENSWGEDRGEKGYLIMTADWFKEFVFEVVVDKSHVPADVLSAMEQTPIVLPAWDPMGTLAK